MKQVLVILGVIFAVSCTAFSEIGTPGDCTRSLFQTAKRSKLLELQNSLRHLAANILSTQELQLKEADPLLTDVWAVAEKSGPISNSKVVEDILRFMQDVELSKTQWSSADWQSLTGLWASYLKALADDLESSRGWSPCGWMDEAHSFKTDAHWLFAPITIWKDMSEVSEAGSGLWVFFMPFEIVGGALGLAADTITLVPNIGGRTLQKLKGDYSHRASKQAWESIQHLVETHP